MVSETIQLANTDEFDKISKLRIITICLCAVHVQYKFTSCMYHSVLTIAKNFELENQEVDLQQVITWR